MASSHFCSLNSFCAWSTGFAKGREMETFGLLSLSADQAVVARPAPRTNEALTASATRVFEPSFETDFMLVTELRSVHEPNLLHVIALSRSQHNRHAAVLGTSIGTQMDFRLWFL